GRVVDRLHRVIGIPGAAASESLGWIDVGLSISAGCRACGIVAVIRRLANVHIITSLESYARPFAARFGIGDSYLHVEVVGFDHVTHVDFVIGSPLLAAAIENVEPVGA